MSERITNRNLESETVFAKGKMFELIHKEQSDGRIFEVARRAPGVRLIIADKDEEKILLTKEFRSELNDWDYRLPGGKVFDSLDEYESYRNTGLDIELAAFRKAKEESIEEAGIVIEGLDLYKKSTLGATVEWDLFVFEANKWRNNENGQQLEDGEQIETDNWFSYSEAEELILDGKLQEERIALILLRWISREKDNKLVSLEKEVQLKFKIYKMAPDDIEAASEMRAESWLDTYVNDELGITREWIEERNKGQLTSEKNQIRKERLLDTVHHAGWVAKDEFGNIIGSTTPFIHDDGRQDVGSLYIKKEWHGKGVANELMQEVINWFDPNKPIELVVVRYNDRAQAFYKKWGFEIVPGSEGYFDNKIPEIKMMRKGDKK